MAEKAVLAKRTYKLSEDTLRRFERVVPVGQRSQTVERLLRASIEEIEREALRQAVIEGLEYMADVGEEAARAWASTENDGWSEP